MEGGRLDDFVDRLWGTAEPSKQGFIERRAKSWLKRAARGLTGYIAEGVRSGDISVTVGGQRTKGKGAGKDTADQRGRQSSANKKKSREETEL